MKIYRPIALAILLTVTGCAQFCDDTSLNQTKAMAEEAKEQATKAAAAAQAAQDSAAKSAAAAQAASQKADRIFRQSGVK